MAVYPREHLLDLSEALHGAIDPGELVRRGIDPAEVLDFSSNVNPYGPSPSVRAALERVPLECYPDRNARQFCEIAAACHGVPADWVLAGNGSSELLLLMALAYLERDSTALVLGPTYSEYARVAAIVGARVETVLATAETGFAVPVSKARDMLDSIRPRICFLCNPNNPTGQPLPSGTIRDWAERFPSTLFVVDEAYAEFAPAVESAVPIGEPNVLVLRSMTKAWGLAGLRLGYAMGDLRVIDALRRVRIPWSVSSLAQAAGIAALHDGDHLRRTLARIAEDKSTIENALRRQGAEVIPSAAHFFLVRVADAAQTRARLLAEKILVRDCTSFGLTQFIRISPRTPPENERVVAALRRGGERGP
jgi:L-threonine-O-3-phosphate decarboxylase